MRYSLKGINDYGLLNKYQSDDYRREELIRIIEFRNFGGSRELVVTIIGE